LDAAQPKLLKQRAYPGATSPIFFALKHHEKLAGKGYTGTIFEREEIEIESKPSSQGQSWFLSVPSEIASAYWLRQVRRGNKAALALCMAPIAESLERRFDQALGITRTGERNEILSQRVRARLLRARSSGKRH
jgi:hypothetical protein